MYNVVLFLHVLAAMLWIGGTSALQVLVLRAKGSGDALSADDYDRPVTRPENLVQEVKRIVDIALPRPRTSEIVSSTAFGHHVAEIWNDLREEASRGMRDEEAHARQTGERAR